MRKNRATEPPKSAHAEAVVHRLKEAFARIADGDRATYVDIGTEVREARSQGHTCTSLAANLKVDPSILADCSRMVAAWHPPDAREALASLSLAHLLALVPVRDNATRRQIAERAHKERLSVARTRELARAVSLRPDEWAEREAAAVVAGLTTIQARLESLLRSGNQVASLLLARSLADRARVIHRLATQYTSRTRAARRASLRNH